MFRRVPKVANTATPLPSNPYNQNRYGNPSSARRPKGSNNAHTPAKPKGLFADGIWHCNCTVRLPAEHFRVKKEGKNHGRWFYTCQNGEPKRCDFFLWDEDAKPREEAAVLAGRRTEPGREGELEQAQAGNVNGNGDLGARRVPQSGGGKATSPPPPYSILPPSGSASDGHGKRKAAEANLDGDETEEEELIPWPLTGQEEEELVAVADQASKATSGSGPETPRKAQRTDAYATPATSTKAPRRLPWLDYSAEEGEMTTPTVQRTTSASKETGLPTPSTTSRTPIANTAAPAVQVTAETPTPSRYRDALSNPVTPILSSTTTSSIANLDLTSTIFSLLSTSSITLPASLEAEMKSILTRHELKTQGIIKGREMVRLGLKAKEAKVVELMARMAALEAEREVDRALVRRLRTRDRDVVTGGGDAREGWEEEL